MRALCEVRNFASQKFRLTPEQDLKLDFLMKTEPGAGAGVRSSVFTGFAQLILSNLNFLRTANC